MNDDVPNRKPVSEEKKAELRALAAALAAKNLPKEGARLPEGPRDGHYHALLGALAADEPEPLPPGFAGTLSDGPTAAE